MISVETAHTVVGYIGVCVSGLLLLSPLKMVIPIIKKKDVEDHKPYPCIAAGINCLYYLLYAFRKRHDGNDFYILLSINAFGLLAETVYTCVFARFGPHILWIRILVAVVIGLGTVFGMAGVPVMVHTADDIRYVALGIGCVVSGVVMYSSILPDTLEMIHKKSVRHMPLLILVVGFINTLIWLIYSLLLLDLYILVQNAIGLLLNIAQLGLYFRYCDNKNAEEGGTERV